MLAERTGLFVPCTFALSEERAKALGRDAFLKCQNRECLRSTAVFHEIYTPRAQWSGSSGI